jgi:predicted membrane-bound mannosyltransferase
VITCLAFSSVRYKTPWNLLPFYAAFVLLAGYGAAALVDGAKSRVLRGFVIALLVLACGQLGMQNWRANFQYPADPRNPCVYAQTTPDFLRLVRRVTDMSALHPDGAGMLVKVIAGPYEQWPLPWYLRRMTQVGYWSHAAEAGPLADAPVIVASQDQAETVGSALGERYVQEFYGLRPDVMLTVYIERALWDRFIASRAPR